MCTLFSLKMNTFNLYILSIYDNYNNISNRVFQHLLVKAQSERPRCITETSVSVTHRGRSDSVKPYIYYMNTELFVCVQKSYL